MDNPAEKLGMLMRERRTNVLHLTQQETADMLSISLSYYKSLESGRVLPASALLFDIHRKMSISLDSLISSSPIENDDQDTAYHELIRIIDQCNSYQRSVLAATGNALICHAGQSGAKDNDKI